VFRDVLECSDSVALMVHLNIIDIEVSSIQKVDLNTVNGNGDVIRAENTSIG